MTEADKHSWTEVISAEALARKNGKTIVKVDGKQILIWDTGKAVYACNNRCPHEGFPLAEGTMTEGCVLTCNWHNWKFNLESGATLVGGDALRLYPVRIDDGAILLDLTDPLPDELRAKALHGLREAFYEHDYERIAREVARFERAEGDPLETLVHAFGWACDRFEFGMTHAQAAAPDWLALRRAMNGAAASDRLIPVVEVIGHLSWDALMQQGPYPFAQGRVDAYDAAVFEDAIEREDEATAVRHVRAALEDQGPDSLRPALQRAALRHYQNFGHTPIYVDKTYELLGLLDAKVATDLFLPLVRTLCTGAREDLIPEFRAYAPALETFDRTGADVADVEAFRGAGVRACLEMVSRGGGRTEALYDTLMQASAEAMLHFDPRYREHVDKPIQENIDWLDFTHAITHLNASRKICEEQPDLWPNAFLQTGCFLGRNAKYSDWQRDVDEWGVDDGEAFLIHTLDGMLDHGEPLYIYPAHVLKLATAVREEIALRPDAPWVPSVLAALNRFVNEPVKQKHVRRVAHQALSFVEAQG
jgi:nitrite reductase/ring-hydroxylating ferredoxin subunit